MMPSPSRERFRLLVVDDLPAIHEDFRKILAGPGVPTATRTAAAALFDDEPPASSTVEFALDFALQGQEALTMVRAAVAAGSPYALAFVDVRMPPGWNGIETVRHLWTADPALQVVLCTAYSDFSWAETTRELGHTDSLIILKKPFETAEVLQLAHALTRKWQLARAHAVRVDSLDQLVRLRTEELRDAQETFTQAFAASPLAQVIVTLDENHLLAANAAFERLFAYSPQAALGASPAVFGLAPAEWAPLAARLRAGEAVEDYAYTFKTASGPNHELRGSARAVVIAGRPCSIWVVQDVTDRLQLEAQLRQSQKMQAIGQLTAGFAHDFNNLLTGIIGHTTELLDDPANARLRPLLEPINASANHGAALTRQLLVFSSKQITQIERIDPRGVMDHLEPLFRGVLGPRYHLSWSLSATLPAVMADAAALEQIAFNLLLNARDALPAGGHISLVAEAREFATAAATGHAEGRAGRFLALSVSDDGCGIAPEILPRIFEPFFTTKDVGKGTGLGLATVYTLVQQHKGWIDVRTTLGVGSTFTVFVPLAEPIPVPVAAPPAPAGRKLSSFRVLAVDDDSIIRQILKILLMKNRVAHVLAEDGVIALEKWRTEGPFDLLLTDIVMPNGVSGIDLARELRNIHPALPVVFITGYSPDHVGADKIDLPGPVPRVVLKPFATGVLMDAVREALEVSNG